MIWNSSYTPYEPPMPKFSHPSDLQTSSESRSPQRLLFLRSEWNQTGKTTLIHGELMQGPQTRNCWKHHETAIGDMLPWFSLNRCCFFLGGCRIEPFCISFTKATLAQGSLWQHRDYRYFAFRGDDPFGDSAHGSSWFTSAAAGTPQNWEGFASGSWT